MNDGSGNSVANPLRSRHGQRWLLGCGNLVAVLIVYFAVPMQTDLSVERMVLNLALTVVGVALVGVVIVREIRAEMLGTRRGLRGLHLVLLLEVVFVVFSITIYSLAINGDNQMAGVETRLDALYFSAATMTTVGYGDIHPVGQLARAIVTGQLIFDVIFLAFIAGLVRARLRPALEGHGGPDRPTGTHPSPPMSPGKEPSP